MKKYYAVTGFYDKMHKILCKMASSSQIHISKLMIAKSGMFCRYIDRKKFTSIFFKFCR